MQLPSPHHLGCSWVILAQPAMCPQRPLRGELRGNLGWNSQLSPRSPSGNLFSASRVGEGVGRMDRFCPGLGSGAKEHGGWALPPTATLRALLQAAGRCGVCFPPVPPHSEMSSCYSLHENPACTSYLSSWTWVCPQSGHRLSCRRKEPNLMVRSNAVLVERFDSILLQLDLLQNCREN